MCTRCHRNEGAGTSGPLGPDLSTLGKSVPDTTLIEAILEPSKLIKKGYETVTVLTDDGQTASGLLAEDRADAVILRDLGQDGKLITIAKSRIEQRAIRGPSTHAGRVGERARLAQQFLDLVRYVMEIAEHGPARHDAAARPGLLAPPLPTTSAISTMPD